jgi:hypothetical protein
MINPDRAYVSFPFGLSHGPHTNAIPPSVFYRFVGEREQHLSTFSSDPFHTSSAAVQYPESAINSNGLDLRNLADDFEVHQRFI